MSFKIENFIASQTHLSRRKILELLNQNAITLNGHVVTSLTQEVNPKKDDVKISGETVIFQFPFVYYMFYKPKGVICTTSDPKGRRDLTEFLRHIKQPVFPVGRLDRQTSGLLLLTNDGHFSHQILHPKFSLKKTYLVGLDHPISKQDLNRLSVGMILEDGPVQYTQVLPQSPTQISLSIHQGRNRIVRRTFEFLGYEVKQLKRTAIGSLSLYGLKEGDIKPLSKFQVSKFNHDMGTDVD